MGLCKYYRAIRALNSVDGFHHLVEEVDVWTLSVRPEEFCGSS
jgi:hypothetical protein